MIKKAKELAMHEKDTGSSEVQVALLTERIETLSKHIKQFKKGGICHPINGLALSKNAHWLFDQGFWSIDNDFCILVDNDRFEEDGENALLLKPRSGERVFLPRNEMFWPDRENLKWHRSNHKFE